MASSFRPYYPRVQNRPQAMDDAARGFQAGGMAGKALETLGSAIATARTQANQDKVANQLLNQDYPSTPADPNFDPDADISTDLPEDVSTDVGGTASPGQQGNFQGGQAELAMRMQTAKEQLGMQDMQQKIAQSKAAAALTNQKAAGGQGVRLGGGSSSRWIAGNTGDGTGGTTGAGPRGRGAAAGKPAAYVGGSGDVENDESTDDPNQIAADFDSTYGQKGLYGKYASNLPSLKPDADGNYPLTDAKGETIASIPKADAAVWQQRTNAARVKRGLSPIGPLGDGQNPTSNAPVGTAGNPVVAQSTLHVRSLPFGTVVYDPNTKQTYTKQKPPTQ